MRPRPGRDFAERELVAFVAGSAGSLRRVRDVSTTTGTAGPASGPRSSVKVAEKPTGVDRDARMRRLVQG
ncbi:MAG: hypothetical protein ACRD0P_39675, partial [Stackebrandtia sp.]